MAAPAPSLIPQEVAYPGATPEERHLVGLVVDRVNRFEKGIGADLRRRERKFFHQYRAFRQLADRWEYANDRRDRDEVIHDAKRHWGAHLSVPLSFRAVETIVPRAIAQMPKMLVLPRDEQDKKNVETMRLLLDWQQEKISIDLAYQDVLRSGLIYGLGVSKVYWRHEEAARRILQPRTDRQPGESTHFLPAEPEHVVTFDDPMYEHVDLPDFFWDPYGYDMRTCKWTVHRLWLSYEDVLRRIEGGQWNTPSAQNLDENRLRGLGGAGQRYDEIWQPRMHTSGLQTFDYSTRGEQPYEVLEYHNGQDVVTVLNRQVFVASGENPVGEQPFQVFRPVPQGKQMMGIGVLEPLEHLQRGVDTTVSQQVDLITVALSGGFAYEEGTLDPDDVTFGPAMLLGINNANPNDVLMKLPMPDISPSAFQHEAMLRNSFDLVSGLSDAQEPSAAGSETATGAMLSNDALNARVGMLSKRFEVEVVTPSARQFIRLNQRKITDERAAVRVPEEGATWDMAYETGAWRWLPISPFELAGEFEVKAAGGSMAAKNRPLELQEAQILQSMEGDFYLDPVKIRLLKLEKLGVKHPTAFLRDPQPPLPKSVLWLLVAKGYDPLEIAHAVVEAKQLDTPQGGPPASQITDFASQ